MKALKSILFVSVMLVSLTACEKEEVSPLCGEYSYTKWYTDPNNSLSDYYYFNTDGSGGYYDQDYYRDNYGYYDDLDKKFTWEADDTYLFLYYNYYDSYYKNQEKYTKAYYYAISGKHLILYDLNFKHMGTYYDIY